MTRTQSLARALVACAGLALCAAALPAAAQQTEQADHTADSVTVARDATTGKLRAATAEEQASMHALKAKSMMRVATPQVQQKFHASGARGARLTDEMVNASAEVAVRTPDGKIVIAHGATEAEAKANARATNTVTE